MTMIHWGGGGGGGGVSLEVNTNIRCLYLPQQYQCCTDPRVTWYILRGNSRKMSTKGSKVQSGFRAFPNILNQAK